MSFRTSLFLSIVCLGLLSCGKKDEAEAPECAEAISETEDSFASSYAEYYCDLRDQCLDGNDESIDDCKKRTSRGQLERACDNCSLDGDKVDACLEAAGGTSCSDWQSSWGGDEKKPVKACDHVWTGCDGGDE